MMHVRNCQQVDALGALLAHAAWCALCWQAASYCHSPLLSKRCKLHSRTFHSITFTVAYAYMHVVQSHPVLCCAVPCCPCCPQVCHVQG